MSDVIVELKEFNVEFDDTNTSKSANIVSGHDIKESFATIHKRLNNIGYTWGTEYISMGSSADLNNYKTPGIYACTSNSPTITHGPNGVTNFKLFIIEGQYEGSIIQYVLSDGADAIYSRVGVNIDAVFSWISDWKRLGEQVILSYGNSTWDDFYNAYIHNSVVYCRASSNTDPATGSQTRMAFMAYVDNGDDPTNVEFQYYRSVSSHSDSQQGDQVFIYKLVKNSGWSVTKREASSKIAVTSPIAKSYSSGTITLSHATSGVTAGTYDSVTVDAKGHVTTGSTYTVDSTPTENSTNFVTSGGVYSAIDAIQTLLDNNDNIISGYVSDNTGTTKTVITSGVNATKSVKDGTIAYITFKEDNTATYTEITTTGISLSVNGTSALISEIGNECYDYDNTSTVNPAVGSIDTMYIELNPRYGIQGCTNLYIYKDFGNNNTKWIYLCSTGLDLWSFYNFTGISGTLQNIYMNTNSSGYSVNLKGDTVFPFALATCDTSASAQNKVASVSQSTWSRKVGCIVAVKYANTNTYNANSSTLGTGSITLNVNGTGAANIYYGATADPTGTNTAAFGYANRYAYYMWDGTYWVWLSQSTDNNTTYSAISQANITNGSGTSSGLITGQRAKQAVDKFAFGTNSSIPTNSDLNDSAYAVPGVWSIDNNLTIANVPALTSDGKTIGGRLETITTRSDSYLLQIYYAQGTCPQVYVRRRYNTWEDWTCLNSGAMGIIITGATGTENDLDNFTTPGIYNCQFSADAKKFLHTPFQDADTPISTTTGYDSTAFKLTVEYISSSNIIRQTLITATSKPRYFVRNRISQTSGGTTTYVWQTWHVFEGTAIT